MTRAADAVRINLVQGEFKVSDDPGVVLTTLLGSCVGACIRDPVAGVGGMNHFLLPGAEVGLPKESERLGVHLMELLLNGLMRQGAHRSVDDGIFAHPLDGIGDVEPGRVMQKLDEDILSLERCQSGNRTYPRLPRCTRIFLKQKLF